MINLQARCLLQYEFNQPTMAVFMLRPRSGLAQWVSYERYQITPQPSITTINEYTDSFGNVCQRVRLPQGLCTVESVIDVSTTGFIDVNPHAMPTPILQLPPDVMVFLRQSRYCLPEFLFQQAIDITKYCDTGYAKAKAICDYIQQNFVYEYGSSNNNTTALDAWKNKKGVCRDFTHVGISLCRALDLPARMVVGYLYGLKPMDLHAWYEVFLGGRWYTFDATQSEPNGGRIIIAYGQDASDVAFATFFDNFTLKDMQVSVTQI